MRMKIVLLIICSFWTTVECVAQDSYSKEYRNALRYGANVKITLKVSAPGIGPVTNATVNAFFEQRDGNQYKEEGATDALGICTVDGMTRSSVAVSIIKDGFYRSVIRLPFATGQERIEGSRWLPWNPTIPVVLREVRKPIPMYVKRFDGKLANGMTAGFDCETGDFLPPHGNGKTADFTITLTGSGVAMKKTRHTLQMASLDPAGGFHVAKLHQQSAFKSDYQAPQQGYSTNVFAEMEYDSSRGVSGSPVFQSNEYIAFKSRIKRDADGSIIGAHYGKFYSGIEFMRGLGEYVGVGFLYYFNPTPNDRNLEFDGKNNLFKPGWNSKLNWSREP